MKEFEKDLTGTQQNEELSNDVYAQSFAEVAEEERHYAAEWQQEQDREYHKEVVFDLHPNEAKALEEEAIKHEEGNPPNQEELHKAVVAFELELFETDLAIAEIEYGQALRDPTKTNSERELAQLNIADARDRFNLTLDSAKSEQGIEHEFTLIDPEDIEAINEEYLANDHEWDFDLAEDIKDEFGFAFNDAAMER